MGIARHQGMARSDRDHKRDPSPTNRDASTQFDQSHAWTDARGCWNRARFNSPFVKGESFTIGGFHEDGRLDLIGENIR